MSQRFEMRLPDDLVERLDEVRGDVPRATYIKRALAVYLRPASTLPEPRAPVVEVGPVPAKPPREPEQPVPDLPMPPEPEEEECDPPTVLPVLPKIAPRHWAR